MAFVLRSFYTLTLPLGRHFAGLFGYTHKDVELMYPFKEKIFYSLMRESGYMHIQATKPDTVGEHWGSPAPGLPPQGVRAGRCSQLQTPVKNSGPFDP